MTTLLALLQATLGPVRGPALSGLLVVEAAPTPFEGGVETTLDLQALAAGLDGVDLAALPGVPARAVRSRQVAFVGGRLCAELALAVAGAAADEAIDAGSIGADAQGRPVWPTGWTGSITHAAGVAIAAVRRREGRYDIGLDTEALLRDEATCAAVRSQCLCDEERARAALVADRAALTVLFSAKEAYYKAVSRSVGRWIGFDEMALQSIDVAQGRFRLVPVAGAAHGELPAAAGHFSWHGERVVTRIRLADSRPETPPGNPPDAETDEKPEATPGHP